MDRRLSMCILFDPPRLHRWEALEFVQGLVDRLLETVEGDEVLLLTGAESRQYFPHSRIRVLAFEQAVPEVELAQLRSLYGFSVLLKVLPCQLNCSVAGDVHLLPDLHGERFPMEAPAHFRRDLELALAEGSLLLTPDLETAWQLHHHPDWSGAEIVLLEGVPQRLPEEPVLPAAPGGLYVWYPLHRMTPDPEPLLQILEELDGSLVTSGDDQLELTNPRLRALGPLDSRERQAVLEQARAIWAPPPQSGYGVLAARARQKGIPIVEQAADLPECLGSGPSPAPAELACSQAQLLKELLRRWGAKRDDGSAEAAPGQPLAWLLPPGHEPPEAWREPQDLSVATLLQVPTGVKSVLALGGEAPFQGQAPWVRFLGDRPGASDEFELELALERALIVLDRLDMVVMMDDPEAARALFLSLGRQPRPLPDRWTGGPGDHRLEARLFEAARQRMRAATSRLFLRGLSDRFWG